MLLAAVMIIGLVPAFELPAFAGFAEDYMEGKTVITKVELTIEDFQLHNELRGYDAGWMISSCVINDSSQPYYCPKDIQVGMWQSYGFVGNSFLWSSELVRVGIPLQPRSVKTGGDADYTFDLWHPEEIEIWVNGVKREDAYVKIGYSEIIDIVIPYEVAKYDGPECTVTFDAGGAVENKVYTPMVGGYVSEPFMRCEGKVFEGWYEDPEKTKKFDFENTQIYEDMTLYARWRDILPTETITKLELELAVPRLHDGMTYKEAVDAFDKVYDYDEKGYHLSYARIYQPVEQKSDDYLYAGVTTYVEACVYAIPYGENVKSPPYTFDWNNLDDIEIWIDGELRTDAVVSSYDEDWRLIRIRFPVTVVHETPYYEEVIDSEGYTRYVKNWEGLVDVMSDLNEDAIRQFGKLNVVLTEDITLDESCLYYGDKSAIRLDVPAGLDVVFDFRDHTISGDLDLRKVGDEEYALTDFLLFRLGKDAGLTLEGERSGGVAVNVIQDSDYTFSAIRVMSDTPRDSRNDPYRGKLTVNGGTYTMTTENEDRHIPRGLFGKKWLYRGTFIADHVETEINDGFFNLVADEWGGRATAAFATVVSNSRLHLETAPKGAVTPYIETGHTVINGGRFTALTGGYAVHHFDTPYYIIENRSCDYAKENKAAPENSYYHINYPTICGGSFSGRIGFTGFTTAESDGNEYLNERSISLMLPEKYVATYYDKVTDSEIRNLSGLTWKDLHENTRLVIISDTILKSAVIMPNGGEETYRVKEGTEVTFKVQYEWADWLEGSFPVTETWTVDPTDPGYESYSQSGNSIKISFAEKQHRSGVTLQARALIHTGYGQLVKTIELPVTVWRKVDILTYTPNLTYEGPDCVMDGEGFYFYIREKECYEYDPSTLVVEVDGEIVKPVGDGRYIVNNVKWKANTNIQINATAEAKGYSTFTFIVPISTNKVKKVYKGELLTLPFLFEVGFKVPTGMVFTGWRIPGYGIYQPGETVKVTTTKAITVTATFEGLYSVIMEDGAKAYSDEAHTTTISGARENDCIYIVAPEMEEMQFYMWDYELTRDTYQRPYFGDVSAAETWVMMPPSGIILTPLYTTAVTEINIYGVVQPVTGEKYISICDDYGKHSDGIRETDKLSANSNWYRVVGGENVSITYSDDVIFTAGETYRYEVLLNVPMTNEGIYDFPLDINDLRVNIENISASAYTLTKEYTNKWRDYLKVTVEFAIPSGVGVTLSGTVTGFGEDGDTTMVELIPKGETKAAHFTMLIGRSARYSFVDVKPGTYTLRVSKDDHVTREYTVTVGGYSVTQDAKIHLKGDVNGDGKVNTTDVGRANAHAKKTTLLTGYELACSDINGDGRVNTTDVGRMNAHAKKTNLLW